MASLNTLKAILPALLYHPEANETKTVQFGREVAFRLIEAVKDLNSCTLGLEILAQVFAEPAIGSQKESLLTKKLFVEESPDSRKLVHALLKGTSSPTLHVTSYN